jgi:hypothetical protein
MVSSLFISAYKAKQKLCRIGQSTGLNLISINNLRSQLYSSVLYYTRISRRVSANSKPSSGVVAYRILKASNDIKKF